MKKIFLRALLTMLLHGEQSQAQTVGQATATTGLEEIVVTAQRRAEKHSGVPLTVSAISASALNSIMRRLFRMSPTGRQAFRALDKRSD